MPGFIPQFDFSMLAPAMLLGVRISGLMTFAPFLNSASIPWQVKSGLTFVLTVLLTPAYMARMHGAPPANMGLAVAGELMIGLGMGLTLELVFEAARFAGTMLGFQFGYSLVNIID